MTPHSDAARPRRTSYSRAPGVGGALSGRRWRRGRSPVGAGLDPSSVDEVGRALVELVVADRRDIFRPQGVQDVDRRVVLLGAGDANTVGPTLSPAESSQGVFSARPLAPQTPLDRYRRELRGVGVDAPVEVVDAHQVDRHVGVRVGRCHGAGHDGEGSRHQSQRGHEGRSNASWFVAQCLPSGRSCRNRWVRTTSLRARAEPHAHWVRWCQRDKSSLARARKWPTTRPRLRGPGRRVVRVRWSATW